MPADACCGVVYAAWGRVGGSLSRSVAPPDVFRYVQQDRDCDRRRGQRESNEYACG
jgi:hypothetical protein